MYQTLAAIDIGSNTVHLIVAATDGQQMTILADESIFVRLADGVWNFGYIPDERILATTQAILHLRGVARSYGATSIIVVTTEVARTARNTQALISAVEATTGLTPLVLSGMDEASLTFQGVTHGRRLPASIAVADLGGGSLEVILAELGNGAWRTSLPVGSAFMHDRFISTDPPQDTEIEELAAFLTEKLTAIPQLEPVDELIVCGGTVNALMRLVRQAEHRAPGDDVLLLHDLQRVLKVMLAQPSEIIASDFRLRLERARLLPAGVMVLEALLVRLALPGMLVSQAGIREGIILAVAMHGENWLEGARTEGTNASAATTTSFAVPATVPLATQPAGEVAWAAITTLTDAFIRHRKRALDGNVNAIHDMRVAARRLRTTLETFAPCFPVTPYRQMLRLVKRLGHALGEVRDTDVALANLRQRLAGANVELVPGLRILLTRKLDVRRKARRNLQRRLRVDSADRLRRAASQLHLDAGATVAPEEVRADRAEKA